MIAAVKGQVWALDPKLPLKEVATIEDRVAETLARPRFNVVLLSIFAGVGLLLAVIGIYGVISYSVGVRRREIGVRMALGANRRDVLRMILRQGLTLALLGVALGLAAAYALTRYLESQMKLSQMLYGVQLFDPLTYSVIALLLMAVALLACWLPARRAARVDPMVALRHD